MTTSVLVGRERELHDLQGLLDELLAGRGGLAVVTGEAGMGKTTVLDVFAAESATGGARVLRGACWSAADAPPLLPWSQVVRAWMRQSGSAPTGAALWSAPLRRLVPELLDEADTAPVESTSEVPPELVESHQQRWSLFEAMASFLGAAAELMPIVVVLDDLHEADAASVQLLGFLAPQLRTQRVLIVAAARREELAEAQAEALSALDSSSRHIELGGLDAPTLARLVHEVSGVVVSDAVARRLHDHTGGNPFFVREVLRLLVAEGQLDRVETLPLPGTVQAVLQRRLRGLSAPCQRVLAVAAVAGEDSSAELIAAVAGLDLQSVIAAIDEAAAARLVVVDRPGRCSFAHAVVRGTVYEALDATTRRGLHQRIGETLEHSVATGARPVGQLAFHFVAALPQADAAKAVWYAAEAGRQASELLAHDTAARHYFDALAALDLDPAASASQRTALLLALGEAQSRAGAGPAATETLWAAADLARSTGDGLALARAALGIGGRMETGTAEPALIALLEEALAAVSGADDAFEARVMARLAHAVPFSERRVELAVRAVELARLSGDRAALASALYVWHSIGWTPTNIEGRLAACHELCALGQPRRDRELAMLGHHFLAYDHAEQGDMGAMERELSICAQLAAELREPLWHWLSQVRAGMRAVMRGRFSDGERIIVDAFNLGAQIEPQLALLVFGSALFPLRMWQGRLGELEPALRAHVEASQAVSTVRCGLAVAYAEMGRLDDARAELEIVMAAGGEALPRHNSWVISVAALVRVAAFLGDASRAATLYEFLLPMQGGAVVGPNAESCFGAVDHFLALAAETMGDRPRAREHFDTAIERNRVMGARPALAETQLEYARFLVDHGDRASAGGLLGEARRSFVELGMTTYLERADELARGLDVEGAAPPEATDNVFRREGAVWRLQFAGSATLADDSKGMHDLAYLLARPGREVHVLDLVARDGGTRPGRRDAGSVDAGVGVGRGDELLDQPARRAYQARIVDLEQDVAEAEEMGDPGRAARARAERDLLIDELARALGLGGRPRSATDAGERARQAVRARIRDTIRKLQRVHPKLGRHLERSIRTGYFCRYEPEEPVSWQL